MFVIADMIRDLGQTRFLRLRLAGRNDRLIIVEISYKSSNFVETKTI